MDTIESSEPCKDTIMSESEDELIECPQEPIKEGQLIDKLLNDFKMDQHQKWYLISTKWWHKWRAFVGLDKDVGVSCEKPSSIDNSHLTKVDQDEITLRKFLTEGVDYELIPEPVWNLLYAWFDEFLH